MNAKMHNPQWSADQLEDWLTASVAKLTGMQPDDIDPEAPFSSLDLDSVNVVDLVVSLEDLLGIEIESTIAWDYPTVRLLSGYIATLAEQTVAAK